VRLGAWAGSAWRIQTTGGIELGDDVRRVPDRQPAARYQGARWEGPRQAGFRPGFGDVRGSAGGTRVSGRP